MALALFTLETETLSLKIENKGDLTIDTFLALEKIAAALKGIDFLVTPENRTFEVSGTITDNQGNFSNKIQAIKYIREIGKYGLKEAKDIVDNAEFNTVRILQFTSNDSTLLRDVEVRLQQFFQHIKVVKA